MRVAHVTTTFGKFSETFIADTVRLLVQRGVECRVLTRAHLTEQTTDGIDVRPVAVPKPSTGLARRVARMFRELPSPESMRRAAFEREIRAWHPGLVHAHFGTNGCFIRGGARRLGIPLVVSFHGFDASRCAGSPVWAARFGRVFQDAAAVTVVSRFMRDRLAGIGCPDEKLHVVRVGVRFSSFLYREPAPRAERIRLLCVGRHVPKKGFDSAIRAVAALSALRPSTRFELDVIGDGPLRPQFASLVAALGLGGQVRLLPACRHDAVAAAMQEADVLVVPSRTGPDGDSEGIPTVVMEACASGLPVIATRHAGIPEAIPAENHDLLAAEGDDADLVARILALSERRSAWSGVARGNLQHVRRHFSLDAETGKLEDVYRQCLARAGSGAASPG